MKVIHVSRQSVHQHVIKARTCKHVPLQKTFIPVLTHSGFSFSNLAMEPRQLRVAGNCYRPGLSNLTSCGELR
jgi:hypothetical protein